MANHKRRRKELEQLRAEAERLTALCNNENPNVCPFPNEDAICPFECGRVTPDQWIKILKEAVK